ncbi:MAG: serine hydrolase domain-containing protein [Acidimicrobiia bacterium]
MLAAMPAAEAETFTRFKYGPTDGGVVTTRTDPSQFKNCANPDAGEDFPTATPEEVGLDPDALAAAADFHTQKLQETLFVLRFGCLVHTGNLNALFDSTPKHQWSITKGVSTTVLGLAVTQGFLSVTDPLSKFFPDVLDEAHGKITVRQMLTHTQGTHMNWTREFHGAFDPDRVKTFAELPFDHEPGTYFEYSQIGPGVLNAVVETAVGRDFQDYAQDELFGPLGIERGSWFWFRDQAGWTEGFSHLHMRPVDMVRIGQFWQQGMKWRGDQLVDPGFVADSKVGTESNPAFGYQTWINRAPRHVTIGLPKRVDHDRPPIASAPQDMFYSWGWRGRHHFMMPNLGLLVVSTPVDHDFNYNPADVHTFPLAQGEQQEGYHEFFRILMRAVTDQEVPDPGDYTAPAQGPEGFDAEQFIEPEHNASNLDDGFETRGVMTTGADYVDTVTSPQGGPFVPLH